MKKFRLIRSAPAEAAYNMSLDRKIFAQYLVDRIPVLRIYSWSGPSFTYGVSQDAREYINLPACAADGIGVSQRITGGGVLFHDNEITYSFVCSKEDIGEPESVLVSYRSICSFLIRFYESLGIKAQFALETKDFHKKKSPSEFCSASFEKYDVIINRRKIGGNAQKRARQVIFQHGSVPITIDWDTALKYLKFFPGGSSDSITSLSQELKITLEHSFIEDKLIKAFADTFAIAFSEEELYPNEAVVVE